jgi:hypothetical protein
MNMETRVSRLEARVDGIEDRLDDIRDQIGRLEHRMIALDAKLDAKLLGKWDVAQVVFLVVGALMAAAIFGPRLAAMLAL